MLGFGPRDPHGEIRAGILCRIQVLKSQMVGWRPIWWRKGVTWGPLGFRAQPAPRGPHGAHGAPWADMIWCEVFPVACGVHGVRHFEDFLHPAPQGNGPR